MPGVPALFSGTAGSVYCASVSRFEPVPSWQVKHMVAWGAGSATRPVFWATCDRWHTAQVSETRDVSGTWGDVNGAASWYRVVGAVGMAIASR